MAVLEAAILETAETWENEGIADGQVREIIGAEDETFLQRMMLVFIDLVSGYLVFEEVAEQRTYDTWYALVEPRGERLGTAVVDLVSDRAKALIKLAETGLGCLSIPDLFHLIHDLVKSYSLALLGRLRHARQALSQAQERLRVCQGADPSGAEAQQAQAVVEARAAQVQHWKPLTAPIGSTWKACRCSCIRGVLSTRHARRHTRLNTSCRLRSPHLKCSSKRMGCLPKRRLWTRCASSSLG